MQLIGILRWMCELGRIDICTEVSMLSSYSAMPCEGHLKPALHVFSYLKSKSNSRLIFDPMEPDVGDSNFAHALGAHIPTKKNLADLFTKVLYGQAQRFLVSRMLWDVFPGEDAPV